MPAIFTKLIAILLGLIAIFTGGKYEQVDATLANEVTTASEEIVVEIFNYTGKTLSYDMSFTLEKQDGDTWISMEPAEPFPELGIVHRNLTTQTFTVDLLRYFGGPLEEGTYRLSKTYHADYSFTIEFTI